MAGPAIPLIGMAASAGLSAAQSSASQKGQANSQYANWLQQQHQAQLNADRASEQTGVANARQMMENTAMVVSAGVNASAASAALGRQAIDATTESHRRLSESLAMQSLSSESRGIAPGTGSAALLRQQSLSRAAKEASAIELNMETMRQSTWNQYDAAINTAKYTQYAGVTTATPTYSPNQNISGLAVTAAGLQGGINGFLQGRQVGKTIEGMMNSSSTPGMGPPTEGGNYG